MLDADYSLYFHRNGPGKVALIQTITVRIVQCHVYFPQQASLIGGKYRLRNEGLAPLTWNVWLKTKSHSQLRDPTLVCMLIVYSFELNNDGFFPPKFCKLFMPYCWRKKMSEPDSEVILYTTVFLRLYNTQLTVIYCTDRECWVWECWRDISGSWYSVFSRLHLTCETPQEHNLTGLWFPKFLQLL